VFSVFLGLVVVNLLFKLCVSVVRSYVVRSYVVCSYEELLLGAYFVTRPQAMRSPALPAGSVFMSSALA
jgi:hypothetical protein